MTDSEILKRMLENPAQTGLKVGTLIAKQNSEEGDLTPDGTEGIVLGSMRKPGIMINGHEVTHAYIVKFNGCENFVGILDYKIKQI